MATMPRSFFAMTPMDSGLSTNGKTGLVKRLAILKLDTFDQGT